MVYIRQYDTIWQIRMNIGEGTRGYSYRYITDVGLDG